jgi:DNA repair exonuclease SbcCD ATPase subunit
MQLSAADRRAIIEDLLDIQIFSTMNNVVKNKLSANKEQITLNKSQYEIANTKYDMQQKHINQLKQNNEDKINEFLEDIRSNNNSIQKISIESANTLNQIESLRALVSDKTSIETKLKKITKIESQIESNISKYRTDISFFQHNDDCPTCRQEIPLGFKEQQIEQYSSKVEECLSGLKQIEVKIIDEQTRLNSITEIQKNIQQLQIKIATNDTSIAEIKKYIYKLDSSIKNLTSVKENLDDEDTKLITLNSELKSLELRKAELIEEKSYLDAASLLLKDTGIKTKIIKQYLPIINKLVNKYLTSLDFFVNFNLDESFKETIKSRHRDDFSYNNFSEGEKQRIDMALMLTWRAVAKLKNSSNTNLLILDEIFDSSLDVNGTDELMKILHMLEDVNLFVISHKGDILQDKFGNIIRFDKIKNFSRMIL